MTSHFYSTLGGEVSPVGADDREAGSRVHSIQAREEGK